MQWLIFREEVISSETIARLQRIINSLLTAEMIRCISWMTKIYIMRFTLKSTWLGLERQRGDMELPRSPYFRNGWFHQRWQGEQYSIPPSKVLGWSYTHTCCCRGDIRPITERWGITGCITIPSLIQCMHVLFTGEENGVIKSIQQSLAGQELTQWKRR